MNYQFRTTTTMKPHNNKYWWIDSGIIREINVCSDNLQTALLEYQRIVKEKYYIDISNNALKTKQSMYIDTKSRETVQTGYVITGKTDFQTDSGKWVEHYIELWVDISIITNPFMEVTSNDD